jgi:hypothetical protein
MLYVGGKVITVFSYITHISPPPCPLPLAPWVKVLCDLGMKESDVLFDLGCGDGRWCVESSKLYGNRSVGIDLDAERVAIASKKVAEEGLSHLVTIIEGDIFKTDIASATVLIIYLFTGTVMDLLLNLLHETAFVGKSSGRSSLDIVSVGFEIKGLEEMLCSKDRVEGMSVYNPSLFVILLLPYTIFTLCLERNNTSTRLGYGNRDYRLQVLLQARGKERVDVMEGWNWLSVCSTRSLDMTSRWRMVGCIHARAIHAALAH